MNIKANFIFFKKNPNIFNNKDFISKNDIRFFLMQKIKIKDN